jgi:hypothetical protein
MGNWQIITRKITARAQNSYQNPAGNQPQSLKNQSKQVAAGEVDQCFLISRKLSLNPLQKMWVLFYLQKTNPHFYVKGG